MLSEKSKIERRMKKLQEKCDFFEAEVKEKDKENKLHAIKIKDIIRSQSQFHKTKRVKKLPNLNGSTIIKSKKSKLQSLNNTRSDSEPAKGRAKSIEPRRIKIRKNPKCLYTQGPIERRRYF